MKLSQNIPVIKSLSNAFCLQNQRLLLLVSEAESEKLYLKQQHSVDLTAMRLARDAEQQRVYDLENRLQVSLLVCTRRLFSHRSLLSLIT